MFTCNICNEIVTDYAFEDIDRESGLCPSCGSFCRARALAYLVSKTLYGVGASSGHWKPTDAVVYGVSDWVGLSPVFSRYMRYVNTQFDRDQFPDAVFLDITAPSEKLKATADIVICSDVLEHVPPPAQAAFDGLLALLKPGGKLIFTVPYGLTTTVEHFPELHTWHLEKREGTSVLVNTTPDGRVQEFRDLIFHGGGVDVLEMRQFGLESLREHLSVAGFDHVAVMDNDVPEFGIRIGPALFSRPITASRPATA